MTIFRAPERLLRDRAGLRSIVLPVLLTLQVAGCAAAQAGFGSASWATDHAEILATLRSSADAWNRADLDGHLAVYVDSATFMTAMGPRPGLAPAREGLLRTYWRDGRPRQALSFEQIVTRRLSDDSAMQTGRFMLSGGGEAEQSGWFTLVWIRTASGWRIAHDHTS
jgi:ketosteroid isomerase-like protein